MALLRSNFAALSLARIVWREMCIGQLQFPTEAKIYSKIMQNMKNARKQLKTLAWHLRLAAKLSAAAAASRPSKGGGSGGEPTIKCRRRRRSCFVGGGAARPAHCSRLIWMHTRIRVRCVGILVSYSRLIPYATTAATHLFLLDILKTD